MQKIVPNLWFDHNAAEGAAFYASIFPNSRVTGTQYYPTEGLPEFQQEFAGKELTVSFELDGYRFIGINAGPEFPINPSLSFMVNFDPSRDPAAREHLDAVWDALCEGGKVHMPLDEYSFSPRYGWVEDRFGVSWQLILADPRGEPRPFVMPCLLFGDGVQNRAAEAIDYYASLFPGATIGSRMAYTEPTGPAAPGSLMYSDITLFDQWFVLMDSGTEQDFSFTCGVSLMLECSDQEEIDRYWEALSSVPEAEQCGWCADRFGVAWQVVPAKLNDYVLTPEAYDKLMGMKKIELAAFV